jgi:alpha-tubulin suppressor-like RCC1 family protein
MRAINRAVLALAVAAAVVAAPTAASAVPPIVGVPAAMAWGDNTFGELGDGTVVSKPYAVQVYGLTSGVAGVAAGRGFSLAVLSSGQVLSWGLNDYGQLGDGTAGNHYAPFTVPGLTGITQVAAGWNFSLALRNDGTVWAWGGNAVGQLGDGTNVNRYAPVRVSGLTGVTQIAAGYQFGLALRSDGTVRSWGYNVSGQLGDGTATTRRTPVTVSGLTGVVNIAGGEFHSLAARSDGTAWAWGANNEGQLGTGTLANHYVPTPVLTSTGLRGVTKVAAGPWSSVAVGAGGAVFSWGEPLCGGPCANVEPAPVWYSSPTALPIFGVVQVAAGGSHVEAIRIDNSLWAWGSDYDGELGDGARRTGYTPPKQIVASNAIGVAAGTNHTVAIIGQIPTGHF